MRPFRPRLEEIGKLAGKFGNAYIVIEGNTDASRKGIVPADLVRQLSYDRADSVRKAIMDKYKFDPNKFKVIGNGWDNPSAGNDRSRQRRTQQKESARRGESISSGAGVRLAREFAQPAQAKVETRPL